LMRLSNGKSLLGWWQWNVEWHIHNQLVYIVWRL
jgi:hypothetical protein